MQNIQAHGFPATGGGERVGLVAAFWVLRAGVEALAEGKAGGSDTFGQFIRLSQAEVFGKVGHDEPDLAAGIEVGGGALQKGLQHGTAGVVEGGFDVGSGFGGQPRRVANDKVGAAFGEKIGLQQLDLGQAEALEIGAGTVDGAGAVVGGGNRLEATPGEQGGNHAAAGADVEGALDAGRQGCGGDQIEIFAAQWREHAERHMDARTEGGDFYAFFVPLVGTDEAKQQIERQQEWLAVRFAEHVGQGGSHIGSTSQIQPIAGIDFHQQHIGQTAALRLLHAMSVEIGRGGGGKLAFHGGEQLHGLMIIAAPKQGLALAEALERGFGRKAGLGHGDRGGRFLRGGVAPRGLAGLTLFLPGEGMGHGGVFGLGLLCLRFQVA